MIPDNPRILLSNDDGVAAEGLAVLEEIAKELSDDVWVVAPEAEQSGASRKMSLTEPVMVSRHGERTWSVRGTPSDAAFLGIHDIVPGKKPDLVLSGVNRGQNLAEDVSVSGTVAAAAQAMQLGVPAIALSQTLMGSYDRDRPPFEVARAHAPGLIRRLCRTGWPPEVVLNINFPDVEIDAVNGVLVTRQGRRDQWRLHAERREDLRGRNYYWIGFTGKLSNPSDGDDLHAIYNGSISVTPLHLDLTHEATRARLADALAVEATE